MKAAHDRLQEYWHRSDRNLNLQPAFDQEIRAIELRLDIVFPEDFRSYLSFIGDGQATVDQHMTRWWPIGELKSIPEEYRTGFGSAEVKGLAYSCIFFADFLVWSWAWAICCHPGERYGQVIQIDSGSNDFFVAKNFAAFVDAYIAGEGFVV